MIRSLIVGGIFILTSLLLRTAAEIRHVCVTGQHGHGGDRYGYGDSDPYDRGDYQERDDMGDMGGAMSQYPPTGTLTCSHMNGGSVVVKKAFFGIGMYPGRCQPDGYCGEEPDYGHVIAGRCDGQQSCTVDLRHPVYLKCGQLSTYLRVEYECINSWATYDVCRNVSTVAREPSVFITSPGYIGGPALPPSRGTKMCECIIRSKDRADLYLNYLETKLSSDRQTCPYEYVLLQNKENITMATINNEMEVCGNREIAGRWYKGTLRIILASGGPVERKGMVAKITADNLGNPPRLDIECGTVPNNDLKLQQRPVLRETVAGTITRSRIGPGPIGGPVGGAPYAVGGAPYPPAGPHSGPPAHSGGYHHSRPPMHDDDGPYDDMNEHKEYSDNYYPRPGQHYPPHGQNYPPHGQNYPSHGQNYPPHGHNNAPPIQNYPPPGQNYPPYSQPPNQPRGPPPGPLKTRINIPDLPPIDRRPDLPVRNASPRNKGSGFQPDISRLRVKIAGTDLPPTPPQQRPKLDRPKQRKPPTPPPKKQSPKPRNTGPGNNNRPRQQVRKSPNKKGTGKIVDDKSGVQSSEPIKKSGNGSLVALVFGAIGSGLIMGSVAIIALHNYRKRQRIKREEAEYAYSGGSSSYYGRGWPKEAEQTEPEESVYATVAEVDMYRNPGVNPSGSSIEEATPSVIPAKRKRYSESGANSDVITSRLQQFAYDGPASPHGKTSVDDIAVIEIHRAFDDHLGCTSHDHQHDTDCLRNFGYAGVEKDDKESPYCKSCQILRPPRKRDRNGAYDNNVSVRKQRH